VLPKSCRGRAILAATVASLICFAVLTALFPRVVEPLEGAKDTEAMQNALAGWDKAKRPGSGAIRVAFALGFDYLFIPAYTSAVGFGCAALADGAPGRLRKAGLIAAFAQILTAVSDATENALLLWMMEDGFDRELAVAASYATFCKWALLGVGVLYLIAGSLLRRRH
jgi:hypothetical protein